MTTHWTQEEKELLVKIYAVTAPNELEALFPGKKKSTIQMKANQMGLRLKDTRQLHRLLDNSLESCYWIGFILADGWLTESSAGKTKCTFGITLSDKDKTHLEQLGLFLNVPVNSYTRSTNFKNTYHYHNITVNDNVNVPLIKRKFNINNDKSHNPPDLSSYDMNSSQLLSLIIGYIDGDGSIAKRSNGRTIISIQCNEAWKENLSFIINTLSDAFSTITKNGVSINLRGHASIYIGNQNIVNGLRQFAIDNNLPVLKRKWP